MHWQHQRRLCRHCRLTAVVAFAAIRRIAACGVHRAAAEEVERILRRQLNACTGTCGTAGIGSRTSNGHALAHVEIHHTLDDQTTATSVAVGERAVGSSDIIRRSTCRANRGPPTVPGRQHLPLALAGLRLLTGHIPFVLRGQFHIYGDVLFAGAGSAYCAAAAARAYSLSARLDHFGGHYGS